jgi:hypothetical protein
VWKRSPPLVSVRVGGEEGGALLVLGLAAHRNLTIRAADMGALVADGAHQLAAAVLEHRRAEMRAQAEVDPAQVVLVVAIHREAAQLHDADAVLQLVGDVGQQAVKAIDREVRALDLRPVEALLLHMGERGIEVGHGRRGHVADPALGVLDFGAGPHVGTGKGRTVGHDRSIIASCAY